jgi:hypothetical protein
MINDLKDTMTGTDWTNWFDKYREELERLGIKFEDFIGLSREE